MELRIQTPTTPENWLFRDTSEDNRLFKKKVYLGKNDTEWEECTNEEKQVWEAAHPIEKPEEPVQENL